MPNREEVTERHMLFGSQFIHLWLDIPKEIKKACGADSDYFIYNDFFRFFCCFLAFNHIFDRYEEAHPMNRPFLKQTRERINIENWKAYERERILHFVEHAIREIKRERPKEEWTPLETNVDTVLLSPVVERGNENQEENKQTQNGLFYNTRENQLIIDLAKGIDSEEDEGKLYKLKMQMVFLRIYQVRCNLFHGAKVPSDERDYGLVKASADVLEQFLWLCIKCGVDW